MKSMAEIERNWPRSTFTPATVLLEDGSTRDVEVMARPDYPEIGACSVGHRRLTCYLEDGKWYAVEDVQGPRQAAFVQHSIKREEEQAG